MTEITDEMVERAHAEFYGQWAGTPETKHFMRATLTAALSPPKPEIEVSEAETRAAILAWFGVNISERAYGTYRDDMAKAIRAAYAAKPAPQGVSSGAPVKETGGGVGGTHGRSGDIGYTFHRRKDDPKPQQFYGMNRE